jgi:putative Mg2+ transporter-C (MgtC) family protein
LVATGAAAFAGVAASPLCRPTSPGTVIGAIITGIGFLGAGVIFKEDFNVSGLNTAATLWCSAGVGTLCGVGMRVESLALASVIILINVVLRPIAHYFAQAPADAASEMESTYRVYGLVEKRGEEALRTHLVREATAAKLRVRDLHTEFVGRGQSRISANLVLAGRDDRRLDGVTERLGLLPGVKAVRWQMERSASHFE